MDARRQKYYDLVEALSREHDPVSRESLRREMYASVRDIVEASEGVRGYAPPADQPSSVLTLSGDLGSN